MVGGNVETSQRITDVLLGALGIAAASQGTMNNFVFGSADDSGNQYYETIAGGSGAIEGSDGASAVQVHMTNTRSTDPEIVDEYRRKNKLNQLNREAFERLISKLNPMVAYVDAADVNEDRFGNEIKKGLTNQNDTDIGICCFGRIGFNG